MEPSYGGIFTGIFISTIKKNPLWQNNNENYRFKNLLHWNKHVKNGEKSLKVKFTVLNYRMFFFANVHRKL